MRPAVTRIGLFLRTHEAALKTTGVGLALISSLSLSIAYRGQVHQLRSALAVSCSERATQHAAVHAAIGADVAYYKNQLTLLEANYSNQLKIIRSYPPSSQIQAIERVNANRRALENVLAKNEAAFDIGATFDCAH